MEMYKKLKEIFDNTPIEQLQKQWEELESHKYDSPLASTLIEAWRETGNCAGQSQDTSEKAALLADVSGSTLDFIKELPKLQQCQASLKYQLMLLSVAANKLGLYDAADFIKRD